MGSEDRSALIVHPSFGLMGGDYVTLEIVKALLNQKYDITVASETVGPEELAWNDKGILQNCSWRQLPKPRWNRLKSLQRLLNADELVHLKPDIVFEAQQSSYVMPDRRTISIVYHPGDLLYYWGNRWLSKRELYYRLVRGVKGLV